MQTRFTLPIKKCWQKKIQMACYKSFNAYFMALRSEPRSPDSLSSSETSELKGLILQGGN